MSYELQRTFGVLQGRRAFVSLAAEPKREALVTLQIKWREATNGRTGVLEITNRSKSVAELGPDVEIESSTLGIDRQESFETLILQVTFEETRIVAMRSAASLATASAPPGVRPTHAKAPSVDRQALTPSSSKTKPMSPIPTGSRTNSRKARSIESYQLTIADFAPQLSKIAGVSVDRASNLLSVARDKHDYVWLTDIAGFQDALHAQIGQTVEMSIDGVSNGEPNIEAFLGLRYNSNWKNAGARTRRPVAVQLNEGFLDARVGLRLLGQGAVEGLKIGFRILSSRAVHERLEPENERAIDSYVLRLADFAPHLSNVEGASANLKDDLLEVDRDKHEYVWLAEIPGFFAALRAQAGQIVQMTIDGTVRGAPNFEAFLGLKHGEMWRNAGARPHYPVAVRLNEGFSRVRVGLRLAGKGSLEALKVGFKVQPELEVRNRISLRRLGEENAQVGRLKIALIGDPFTVENFEGVADKILIKPHDWRSLLKVDPPDFLFVESAWVGNGGAWANRIVNNTEELESLVRWCKTEGIPTVFWNKEDPIHFHRFLKAARLFDRVYTTCAESVAGYEKEGLRARTLPFSVNLATYNPIGSGQERGRYGIFAGAYYGQKYPDRTADMERMLDLTMRYGLRIFDRNAGATSEEFAFPERFRASILGSADARQLDKEYKRARLAINVNTVKDSRSMFARRVFELAITGTPTISNYSPALVEMFGGGLVASDDQEVLSQEITQLFEDDRHWAERRKSLMRTALMQHTIQDRLQAILADLEVMPPRVGRHVAVFGDHAAATADLPADQFPNVRILESTDSQTPLWQLMPARAKFAAVAMNDTRWDAQTLTEFLRHQEYAQADALGEAEGQDSFRFGSPIRSSLVLLGREALLHGDFTLKDLKSEALNVRLRELGLKTFAVERLTEPSAEREKAPDTSSPSSARAITGWWPDSRDLTLRESLAGELEGALSKDAPAYIRVGDRHKFDTPPQTSYFPVEEFHDGVALNFTFEGAAFEAGLHVFFYREDERLGQRIVAPNTSAFVRAPEGWTHAALAVRVKGLGAFALRVTLEGGARTAEDFVRRALGLYKNTGSAWLCLSSVYPRPENLYRNAFVHTRVKSYLAAKKNVIVVSMEGADPVLSTYEFEGVRVFAGAGAGLADVLRARAWDCVACHIVSKEMLRVMDEHAPGIRKVVWIHAIEAERWYRRSFDVDVATPDLEKRMRNLFAASDERNGAVKLVYDRSGRGLADTRVIFVSHWFRNYIGCVDVRPAPGEYRVINNPIPTNLFVYRPKNAEDRFRWMSVRPYVSLKYGNDMTVAAIVLLSKEPWFGQVSVTLVGRGALWDDTVAPVRGFANVTLENRFLTQTEIADYHARHGIFIGPTRSDSQGVSLGEAMSSGLVPVSNDCQAISEFVPPEWGVLAPPDDAAGLAACIKRLVENPDVFLELSEKGSRHIQEKCGYQKILEQEIAALTEP